MATHGDQFGVDMPTLQEGKSHVSAAVDAATMVYARVSDVQYTEDSASKWGNEPGPSVFSGSYVEWLWQTHEWIEAVWDDLSDYPGLVDQAVESANSESEQAQSKFRAIADPSASRDGSAW